LSHIWRPTRNRRAPALDEELAKGLAVAVSSPFWLYGDSATSNRGLVVLLRFTVGGTATVMVGGGPPGLCHR